MSERPSPPMPDPQIFLLPARAYLLSMRDQNLPMRRAALDDAEAHHRDVPQGTDHERQVARIALVALGGEALQILEDLAACGDSFTSAPEGTAFFAALTNYSPHRINNFYAQMRKRPLGYYLDLLGLWLCKLEVAGSIPARSMRLLPTCRCAPLTLPPPGVVRRRERPAASVSAHEAEAECVVELSRKRRSRSRRSRSGLAASGS